jgi:hypothetical protein
MFIYSAKTNTNYKERTDVLLGTTSNKKANQEANAEKTKLRVFVSSSNSRIKSENTEG